MGPGEGFVPNRNHNYDTTFVSLDSKQNPW